MSSPRLAAVPEPELSLPGWIYRDAEFFEVEMERVVRPSWQVVCHASDIPAPGDWRSLDYLGESVIVVGGAHGEARAFSNVCRHRGSRLLSGGSGCARRLTCPYHAWTYGLDGRLIGVPHKSDYPGLETSRLGLVPVELEDWRGFLFVRLEPGGPSVAEMMAPHGAEIAPYRFEALEALGRVTLRPRHVNWKNVADNYSDGLHIPVAHPGRSAAAMPSRRASMSTGWPGTSWSGPRRILPSAPTSVSCRTCRTSRSSFVGDGSISSCGRTSPSTSTPTRSTSCSSYPSRPPRP
jgi:phenylpropionate dioxygenase-like ring-hydroxylating dioxygenase large terminal subunit